MRIKGSFSRGLASVSVKISCLAHLSEQRAALALTPDPSEAAFIAARHSHATGGRGWGVVPGGWIRNFGICWLDSQVFLIPASSLRCDLSFFVLKANHYILVVCWLWRKFGLQQYVCYYFKPFKSTRLHCISKSTLLKPIWFFLSGYWICDIRWICSQSIYSNNHDFLRPAACHWTPNKKVLFLLVLVFRKL